MGNFYEDEKPLCPAGKKYCRTCRTMKPSEEFYGSHRWRCKVCYRAVQQEYYDTMPEDKYQGHVDRCVAEIKRKRKASPKFRREERIRALAYYHAHKNLPHVRESRRARGRAYYHKKKDDPVHQAKVRVSRLKWYKNVQRDPERYNTLLEYKRKYYHEHKHKLNFKQKQRQAAQRWNAKQKTNNKKKKDSK